MNSSKIVKFRHSGKIGDIVYAIPTIKTMSENPTLFLQPNIREESSIGEHDPFGDFRMDEKTIKWVLPFFNSQFKTEQWTSQKFDVDLDSFRYTEGLDYSKGNICRWYFWAFNVNADLSKPWIKVEPATSFKDTIVVNRTYRYRNDKLDYKFLKNYPKVVFIGINSEFNDFKKFVPNALYIPVKSALEAAQIIAGSKCFIGNQSFFYSIAEALKSPRVLEICTTAWNCSPQGPNGWDVLTQQGFQIAVEQACKV